MILEPGGRQNISGAGAKPAVFPLEKVPDARLSHALEIVKQSDCQVTHSHRGRAQPFPTNPKAISLQMRIGRSVQMTNAFIIELRPSV